MAKLTFTTKLDWTEIDPDTLATEYRSAYEDYKAAYRLAKDARKVFEETMQDVAPEGKRLVFGYNYGKLSIAIDNAKDVSVAKGKQSLSAFLDTQASVGARS